MKRILLVEGFKVLHQRRLAVCVVGLGLFSFLLQIGFRFQGHNPLMQIGKKLNIDVDLVLNAINSTRLIVNACYYLFLPVLAAMIFCGQIAGERASGTLWGILSRPVSRSGLFAAKFIISTLALLGIILFFIGFTLLIGVVLFGTHDFISTSQIFDLLGNSDYEILTFWQGVWRLFLTAVLLTFLLLPTGALGYYFSILFRQTHTAMAATLLVFFGCYILQGLGSIEFLPLFGSIKPYLFTTAMEAWMFIFKPVIAWEEIVPRLLLLLVYVVTFTLAGFLHFHYSDLGE